MKLSEKYLELIQKGFYPVRSPYMLFAGTIPPGPESKSKFPAKVFGVYHQEDWGHSAPINSTVDLEIDNLVAITVSNLGELSPDGFTKVLLQETGENARRIISALDTILESGYVLHHAPLERHYVSGVCIWTTKASKATFPPAYKLGDVAKEQDVLLSISSGDVES